jgi:hypothetical protein
MRDVIVNLRNSLYPLVESVIKERRRIGARK